MKKNPGYLFTGAGMLAVCSVIAKLLGALYRIPLTNVIGGEGMGLYQMVFPLYTLLLTVSSGGLPVAISRLVAVKLSRGDERGARKILRVAVIALGAVGAAGSLVLALLARPIARMQGNPAAALAYYGISPSVALVCLLSCYRGYYQGRENMLPSAASQLVEQAIKLVAGLSLAARFAVRGLEFSVLGALLGVSLSELAATVALALYHAFVSARERRGRTERRRRLASLEVVEDGAFFSSAPAKPALGKSGEEKTACGDSGEAAARAAASDFAGDLTAGAGLAAAGESLQSSCARTVKRDASTAKAILFAIAAVALPVTFGSLVMPLTQLVDSVMIINVLTGLGLSAAEATAAYGLLSGTVMTIVNMPVVVIFAFSAALLPKVAKVCSDPPAVAREAGYSFRLCAALGLWASLALFAFAEPVVRLLYSGISVEQQTLCAGLLRLSSFTVFYVSAVQVATAVLQGLDRARVPAVNLLAGALVKVAVTAILLFKIGIYGAVVGSIGCYAVTAALDLLAVRRAVPLYVPAAKAAAPFLAAAAFLPAAMLLPRALAFLPNLLALAAAAVISSAAYLGILAAFGFIGRRSSRRGG